MNRNGQRLPEPVGFIIVALLPADISATRIGLLLWVGFGVVVLRACDEKNVHRIVRLRVIGYSPLPLYVR
jgi:hypothetical protein